MELKNIELVNGISPDEFLKNYVNTTKPVIMEDFVEQDSPAFKAWNYPYFKELAGDLKVNVYGGELENLNRVASKPVGEMKFSEYLDLIVKKPTEFRLFLFNLLNIRPELRKDLRYRNLMKGKILHWLPFMFFGGEGSITRNHVDIDMSHVFITQFQGTKRIWLFPWEQSDLLYKLPYNFHSVANLQDIDYEEFPALKYVKGFEAVIHPGQTLYIPSGWWHYIQYETEGYSVSVRALPFSILEKWNGFRNMVFTRHFDNLMRKLFNEKWFNYKTELAYKRAEKAMNKASA